MEQLTNETVELLQTMIRNQCVNDGTAESGQEERNADTLVNFIEGAGLDVGVYDAAPGRRSMVARIEGSDPAAPSLCLMGHTDVVPVNPDGWSRDPFGGELVDGEVWGRGAVDMLNLTSSMAVAFRHLAISGFRPKGDLIYFGVADEESGSAYGAQWMADNYPDAIRADYVLTENGGLHGGPSHSPSVSMNVGEKGVAWRRACMERQVMGRLHLEAITLSFEQQRSFNALLTIAHQHVFTNTGEPKSPTWISTMRPKRSCWTPTKLMTISSRFRIVAPLLIYGAVVIRR